MTVVFWVAARDAPAAGPPRKLSLTAPIHVFRANPRAWALTFFYFLSFGGFVAMFLYLPKLLTGVHHLSKTDAGYRAAGFALLAVIARPVGGWLADRIGADRVLRISFAATGVLAIVLAATYEHMVPLTIACLTMAVALGPRHRRRVQAGRAVVPRPTSPRSPAWWARPAAWAASSRRWSWRSSRACGATTSSASSCWRRSPQPAWRCWCGSPEAPPTAPPPPLSPPQDVRAPRAQVGAR